MHQLLVLVLNIKSLKIVDLLLLLSQMALLHIPILELLKS